MTTYFPTQVIEFAIANTDDADDIDLVHEDRTLDDLTDDERAQFDFKPALVIAANYPFEGWLRVQADDDVYEVAENYVRPLDFSEIAEFIF